jgi:hypothetical protein
MQNDALIPLLPVARAFAPAAGAAPASPARRSLTPGVAEYSLEIRVGPMPCDVIGLHRVVREREPGLPLPAAHAVMMVHGDAWDFEGAFLGGGPGASSAGISVYLAENGVDVWGVDLGWTRVREGSSDLGALAGWGFARDLRDLDLALGVAGMARGLSGEARQMHLLGWSRGGQLGYAYLAAEGARPASERRVVGFIPVDVFLKTEVPSLREDARRRHQAALAEIERGNYANDTGLQVAPLGRLALEDPGGPSPAPAFSGRTNAEAALLVGGATYLLIQPPPVPLYHFVAGVWDEAAGLVTGLAHTDLERWFAFLASPKPYQPWRTLADGDALVSESEGADAAGLPGCDRLDRITVPVLYVGSGGGFGGAGEHTTALLGSRDVTRHIVRFHPEEQRLLDAGHADILLAHDAASLFWEPILSWIKAR